MTMKRYHIGNPTPNIGRNPNTCVQWSMYFKGNHSAITVRSYNDQGGGNIEGYLFFRDTI